VSNLALEAKRPASRKTVLAQVQRFQCVERNQIERRSTEIILPNTRRIEVTRQRRCEPKHASVSSFASTGISVSKRGAMLFF